MGKLSFFLVLIGMGCQAFAFSSRKSINFLNEDRTFNSSWTGDGSCSNVPASAKAAFNEAKSYSQGCQAAKLAPGKMIAINDYSGQDSPKMYVFNQSGDCVMALPISWGSGARPKGSLKACSTGSSQQTPPGFHITAPHTGGSRYQEWNSIGLASLSGQDSLAARGILIHATNTPGSGSSWGCTGVPPQSLITLKQVLGYGSLVHNYFGSSPSKECGTNAGFAPPTCDPEPKAVQAHNLAWSGSGNVRVRPNYRPNTNSNQNSGGSGSGSTQEGRN